MVELFNKLAGDDGKVHESRLCMRAEEAGLLRGPREMRVFWARVCHGAMVHPRNALDLPHFRRACRQGMAHEEVGRLLAP